MQILLDRYKGIKHGHFLNRIEELLASVEWRSGAVEFLAELESSPQAQGVILSSGLGILIRSLLNQIGSSIPVLACELHFDEQRTCTGPTAIISAQGKADVVLSARGAYPKANTFQIGHSESDLPMLRLGNGICIPYSDKRVAMESTLAFADFWPLVTSDVVLRGKEGC